MAAKIDANRGDVAEALMGAAVCAAFATRPFAKINVGHIDKYLNLVLTNLSVSFSVPNANLETKVEDNITFSVSLPKKALDFIKVKENRPLVDDLYDSVLSYVNGNTELQVKAAELYKDDKENSIVVSSAGTLNQKGTKADITVLIDGKKQTKQISLKVAGGDQFAQFSGAKWETQVTLFETELGLNISSAEAKFNEALTHYKADARFTDRGKSTKDMMKYLKDAATISYTAAAASMEKNKNTEAFKNTLAEFITKGATLNDTNIELVKLGGGLAKSQSFGDKFIKIIQAMDLSVELSTSGDPAILIKATGEGKYGKFTKMPLIKIRAKFEAPSSKSSSGKVYSTYMRNLVEAPPQSILFKI